MTNQVRSEHPLAPLGYRHPPNWLWGRSRRAYIITAAAMDIWLIVTGRLTLHRAWQMGHDHGHLMEVTRQLNGGR